MGVATGCGCKEVYNYIDFLILLIPTPLVSVLFLQQHHYRTRSNYSNILIAERRLLPIIFRSNTSNIWISNLLSHSN